MLRKFSSATRCFKRRFPSVALVQQKSSTMALPAPSSCEATMATLMSSTSPGPPSGVRWQRFGPSPQGRRPGIRSATKSSWASGNGTAFRSKPYIACIDVHYGSSQSLDVPEEIRNPSDETEFKIGGPGRSSYLSLVLCNRASEFVIWDIKEGNQWAWRKREMKVSMVSMGLRPRPMQVFSLINGETLVFATLNRVYVYELNTGGGRLKRIRRIGEGFPYMCPYANTLQPCE